MESLHEILRIATNQEQTAVQAGKSQVDRLSLLRQKINSKVSQASKSTKWAWTTQDKQSHLPAQSWYMGLCSPSGHMLTWFMTHNNFNTPGKWKNSRQLVHPTTLGIVWTLPCGTSPGSGGQKLQLPLSRAGEGHGAEQHPSTGTGSIRDSQDFTAQSSPQEFQERCRWTSKQSLEWQDKGECPPSETGQD